MFGIFLLTSLIQPARAQLSLPDNPLLLDLSSVLPNILFLLDNSSSMNNKGILDPVVANTAIVSIAQEGDLKRCLGATPSAYDPRQLYEPWPGEDIDGDPFTDKTLTTARGDGRNPYFSDTSMSDGSADVDPYFDDLTLEYYSIWNDANGDGIFDHSGHSLYGSTTLASECGVVHDTAATTDPNDPVIVAERASRSQEFRYIRDLPPTPDPSHPNYDPMFPHDSQQNYANWWTYWATPALQLRGLVWQILDELVGRVGIVFLNTHRTGTSARDIDAPSNAYRSDNIAIGDIANPSHKAKLQTAALRMTAAGATPLRERLVMVGNYFDKNVRNTGASIPTGSLGGAFNGASKEPILPLAEGGDCQHNFAVVFTDGQYNDHGNDIGFDENADFDNDTDYDFGPHGSYPRNTMADIAMYFYERDLAPDLPDNVDPVLYRNPVNSVLYEDDNPAQHMVTHIMTYGLNAPRITLPLSHDASASGPSSPGWPDWRGAVEPVSGITGADEDVIDDMLHASYNGRGLFITTNTADEILEGFRDIIRNIRARTAYSASNIAVNSTELNTGSRLFQARFLANTWTGELSGYSLNPDGSINQEVWNSDNILTGISSSSDRNIYTAVDRSGGSGFTAIRFTSTPAVDADLNLLPLPAGLSGGIADLVEYLSGVTTQAGVLPGQWRVRDHLLGDIVSSSPFVSGYINFGYSALPGTEGSSYPAFLNSKNATFTNISGDPQSVIYIGANDGMLHAFHDPGGTGPVALALRHELFAYIPHEVHPNLAHLADPGYAHEFFINGSQAVGDACIGATPCNWESILVGALGEGGRAVYALNVTDPFNFSAGDVLWEYSATSFLDAVDRPNTNLLGHIKAPPKVVRLNNGKWGVIFGNGYNSDTHEAVLFILDAETGDEIAVINTRRGDAAEPNGLAQPLAVDENGDRIVDIVYAGDLHGHLFKFDLTDSDPNRWGSVWATGGASPRAQALFRARRGGEPQPITTQPSIVLNPAGGFNIVFGTGKYLETSDAYETVPFQIQTLYSIWDDALDATSSQVYGRSNLVEQEILEEVVISTASTVSGSRDSFGRITSANQVNYRAIPPQKGWYMDLLSPALTAATAEGERVVADPQIRGDRAIFPTFTTKPPGCRNERDTSSLIEIDALHGARFEEAVFDSNDDGVIDERDFVTDAHGNQVPISGISIPGTLTTPTVVTLGDDDEVKYTSSSGGGLTGTLEEAHNSSTGRQSWRQLR